MSPHVFDALAYLNIALAVATYLTWVLGTVISRLFALRPLSLFFVWMLGGYTLLYLGDVLAIAYGIYGTPAWNIPRLSSARLVVLGACWRALLEILWTMFRVPRKEPPDART